MDLDWYIIWDYRYDLLDGLYLTLYLSLISIFGATILGVLAGWVRTLPFFYFKKFVELYVESMRNIPILVKLFYLHFVMGVDAIPAGLLALILHQGAYISDVTVSGLQSIAKGQSEAGVATGLSTTQTWMYILLPQAVRVMIPPLTTQYTQVIKNSSVVMLIALEDLTFMTQKIENETFRGMEAAITVTLMYLGVVLVIAVAMTVFQRWLDKRFA